MPILAIRWLPVSSKDRRPTRGQIFLICLVIAVISSDTDNIKVLAPLIRKDIVAL